MNTLSHLPEYCRAFLPLALLLSPSLPLFAQNGSLPPFGHVFIVVGENQAFDTTYNNSNMPYLTSLANKYGLATKYWADSHPSIGNYFAFSAGQLFTDDDSQTPSSMPLSAENIAHELQSAGKTWKDYVESLPSVTGCGGLTGGAYYVRHDPLQYFTNINTETGNYVCFSQFATDLANQALPNLSWLVPNGCDDAHDCSVGTFDNWLQTEIAPLLASSYFQASGDGLLIITWDEDDHSGTPDCETTTLGLGCGGQVLTVMISPYSKLAYQSTMGDPANYNTTYDGANLLRTMAQGFGLDTSTLAGAASRLPMADFFNASTSTGKVTLSPTSLSFGSVTVGTSASLPITLNNGTSAAVGVSGMGISPTTSGFTQTNNCPSSLLAGTNCTISVIFKPTTSGALSATLSVTAGGSNLTAGLGGGGSPAVSLSPGSLTFASQMVGTTSTPQSVTLSNTGSASLSITGISISAPFAQTNNCGSSVAAGGNCIINVTFAPTASGTASGTLAVSDNATGSPHEVSLTASGEDYIVAVPAGSSTSVTVAPGHPAAYTLSVGGLGGFNQSVRFTCTGAPSEATCTVSPNLVTPGVSTTNITVSVTTTAPSASLPRSRPLPLVTPFWLGPGNLLIVLLLLAGLAWVGRTSRLRASSSLRAVFVTRAAELLLTLALAGCGGGGGGGGKPYNPGTPAGTYTLTVTGTAGSGSSALSHSVTLTLTVS
jgi:hypothetical protein